jgi:hypothetical protein
MLGVFGVSYARLRIQAINGKYVVFRYRAPMDFARLEANPALDPREQALDARAVAPNPLAFALEFVEARSPMTV